MSDTPLPPALIEAEARSRNARERLFGTLGQMQHKLNPVALAQDAVETVAVGVMRDTVETVRTRPRTMLAAAGVAVLFMARKPLARLLWNGAKQATSTGAASLKAKRAKPSKKGPTP